MFYCDEEAKRYNNGRKIPKEIFKHVSLVSSEAHVLSSITQTVLFSFKVICLSCNTLLLSSYNLNISHERHLKELYSV